MAVLIRGAGDIATGIALRLVREGLADTVFLNQAESDSVLQDAAVIASQLKLEGLRVVCGSQRQQQYKVL